MKRRLFDLLAAISVTLFIATAIVWIFIGRKRIGVSFNTYSPHVQYSTMALEEAVIFRRCTVPWPADVRWEHWHPNLGVGRDPLDKSDVGDSDNRSHHTWIWSCGRLAVYTYTYVYFSRSGKPPYEMKQFNIVIPYWLLLVVFGLSPLWALRVRVRDRRRYRIERGLCLQCGYDLRATPDRCPECGTFPSRGK